MDPKFANGHVRKGQALEAQLKWRQAAEAYRTGLDFAPDNKTLQFGLKRTQAEDGKKVRWTGASGSAKHPSQPEPEPEPEPPAGDGCRRGYRRTSREGNTPADDERTTRIGPTTDTARGSTRTSRMYH
eukprot:COSAG06_NODE_41053_length_382_cov_1.570946_1_plen_127_part_11